MRLDRASQPGTGEVAASSGTTWSASALGVGDGPAPAGDLARSIVELAPDGILVVDGEGTVSYANPGAADIFGYDRPQLVGMAVDDLVPEGLRRVHRTHRSGYAETPKPRAMGPGLDTVARRADGSDVPVEISLSPVSLSGAPATIAVVRHIGEKRARESEARRRLVLEEEERIAVHLHDAIVRRLFLAAMGIQAVIPMAGDGVAQKLQGSVDELDTAIREIRHAVFSAALPDHSGPTGVDRPA